MIVSARELPLEPARFQLLHTRVDRTWGRAAPTSPHVPQGALLTNSPSAAFSTQRPPARQAACIRMPSRYAA